MGGDPKIKNILMDLAIISIHTSVWEVTAFFRGFYMNFIRKNTKTNKFHQIYSILGANEPVFYG